MNSNLDAILAVIKQRKGIDLKGYKQNLIKRRVNVRMAQVRADNLETYLTKLQTDPKECEQLLNTVGINVSSFFRDSFVFESIAHNVLPSIIREKQQSGSKEIRIWSAGCAAGEEAYSIAILLHQALEKDGDIWKPNIFATDIDTATLENTAKGIYSRECLKDTKLGIIDKYFIPNETQYEVCPFIKNMVNFSKDDLTSSNTISPKESIFGGFDLVLCRNVIIYFTNELQNTIFDKLHKSLSQDGYLILGESESIKDSNNFKVIDSKNKIFQKI